MRLIKSQDKCAIIVAENIESFSVMYTDKDKRWGVYAFGRFPDPSSMGSYINIETARRVIERLNKWLTMPYRTEQAKDGDYLYVSPVSFCLSEEYLIFQMPPDERKVQNGTA